VGFLLIADAPTTLHSFLMIKTFKHKGPKKYFETGSVSAVFKAKHRRKIRMQLAAIDTPQEIEDINLPGFNLHPLKGKPEMGFGPITCERELAYYFEFG